jgi:3-hydroxyethyl bacteriochlorophyllide a dehydrogenase
MREATIRAAAEWQRADMLAVKELAESGALRLDGLITHQERAAERPRRLSHRLW